MSSHHIIRENQEPALLIANGESCSLDILNQLLEWSPYILVLDGAIERVLELGIKVDAHLGDFDSTTIDKEYLQKVQFPIELIHIPDQEKTDLEKGLDFLIKKSFKAVNIIWATGRRADHFVANLSSVIKYAKDIKITLLDDHSSIYPILPLPSIFIKWYTAETKLSLIPFFEAKGLSTKNLVYALNKEDLQLGGRMGNSNQVKATGAVEISYESGNMLIMECRD